MATIETMKALASQVRRDIVRMVTGVQSGHPGGSLGCADFFTAMYTSVMNVNPNNFTLEGNGEDMFFLSNGHISPVWYSVLARTGFFPVSELATFRKIDTRLQGHPTPAEGLPGIRIASGSLGQGLSCALGAALAKKIKNDKNIVYSLHGDGELQEGQIWEAAMFAHARKIDNIISTIDYNKQQIDGTIEDVLALDNLRGKWEAFGWMVFEMNGHDFDDMLQTMQKAKENTGKGKPIMILMHTHMGQGVDFMVDKHTWHGTAPSEKQMQEALLQLAETLGDY